VKVLDNNTNNEKELNEQEQLDLQSEQVQVLQMESSYMQASNRKA